MDSPCTWDRRKRPDSMYQRFTHACHHTLDTLVSQKLKSPKDQDGTDGNIVDERSLPPKPKPARLRRQSAVHSLLRREQSNEVLNRFSASFATYPRRPISPASISAPFNFTHVQPSEPLPPTPTSLMNSKCMEDQVDSGSARDQCKTEDSSPTWVAVDCEKCNKPHRPKSLVCERTMIPAWPFDHPHPLRSNPWEQSRPISSPSTCSDEQLWLNRRVSFK